MSTTLPPPVSPGIVPLRPLGLGEIYDGAISSIRANPKVVLGLSLALACIVAVAQTASLLYPVSADDSAAELILVQVAPFIVNAVASILATGLFTAIVSAAVLGQHLSAREAWIQVKPRFWQLVAITLLILVVIVGLSTAVVLLGALAFAVIPGLGTLIWILGVPAALVYTVYLYVNWLLAPAALIVERTTILGALRRSRTLVKRSWWRVLGITVLGTILASLVASILSIPALTLGAIASLDADVWPLALGLAAATVIQGVVVFPFTAGIMVLLYLDLRMRREGMDLQMRFAKAGLAQPGQSLAQPNDAAAPPTIPGPLERGTA